MGRRLRDSRFRLRAGPAGWTWVRLGAEGQAFVGEAAHP